MEMVIHHRLQLLNALGPIVIDCIGQTDEDVILIFEPSG